MRPACPTHFLACQCLFTACCDVFLACLAETLPTLHSKTWRLHILMRSDQVRFVMFMTGWFSFKYGHFVCSSSRQDGNSIEQEGKCVQRALETHYRMVSRWVELRSGYRVVEGQCNIKSV